MSLPICIIGQANSFEFFMKNGYVDDWYQLLFQASSEILNNDF